MPLCPVCNKDQPARSFRTRSGERKKKCQPCRHREYVRLKARMVRAGIRETEKINNRLDKHEEKQKKQLVKSREKRLKSRYLEVIRTHRTRLITMKCKPVISRRTMQAIETRERILERYAMAYEKQKADLAAGFNPPDIMEYMLDV